MEGYRRRQHRSCDQCRKGKRACDAPVKVRLPDSADSADSAATTAGDRTTRPRSPGVPCSNCKRWKKECTFNWLHSAAAQRTVEARSRKKRKPHSDLAFTPAEAADGRPLFVDDGAYRPPPPVSPAPWPHDLVPWGQWMEPDIAASIPETHPLFAPSPATTARATAPVAHDAAGGYPPLIGGIMDDPAVNYNALDPNAVEGDDSRAQAVSKFRRAGWSRVDIHPSNDLALRHARSTMVNSLLAIYHDSMENALSCWVTERTCPYSMTSSLPPSSGSSKAGGFSLDPTAQSLSSRFAAALSNANLQNRLCSRICKLDQAWVAAHARTRTAREEKLATRALHSVIMAFASQWTHHPKLRASQLEVLPGGKTEVEASTSVGDVFEPDEVDTLPNPLTSSERAVQEDLWNTARKSLDDCLGIASFRVIFANVVFSLTQRPLNVKEHVQDIRDDMVSGKFSEKPLDDIMSRDPAPHFLENAQRQLYTFRYKLLREQRLRHGAKAEMRGCALPRGNNSHLTGFEDDPVMSNPEHRQTFNLLSWLVVMFDTLTAAIYQRPLTIPDDESRDFHSLSSLDFSSSSAGLLENQPWFSMRDLRRAKETDLWTNLFLRLRSTSFHSLDGSMIVRWPCPESLALETISNGASMKVVLYRHVTRLQTLSYRCAAPEQIEEAIEEAMRVYNHWTVFYAPLANDCVAHHNQLPPRIQSWHILVTAHWFLAALIFADTLEAIDAAHVGLASRRESRLSGRLVQSIKTVNALGAARMARSSMSREHSGSDSSFARQSRAHDVVRPAAFMTEPWTVVLVSTFSKAGDVLVDLDPDFALTVAPDVGPIPTTGHPLTAAGRACVDALQCLGCKSDIAYVAAYLLAVRLGLGVRDIAGDREEHDHRHRRLSAAMPSAPGETAPAAASASGTDPRFTYSAAGHFHDDTCTVVSASIPSEPHLLPHSHPHPPPTSRPQAHIGPVASLPISTTAGPGPGRMPPTAPPAPAPSSLSAGPPAAGEVYYNPAIHPHLPPGTTPASATMSPAAPTPVSSAVETTPAINTISGGPESGPGPPPPPEPPQAAPPPPPPPPFGIMAPAPSPTESHMPCTSTAAATAATAPPPTATSASASASAAGGGIGPLPLTDPADPASAAAAAARSYISAPDGYHPLYAAVPSTVAATTADGYPPRGYVGTVGVGNEVGMGVGGDVGVNVGVVPVGHGLGMAGMGMGMGNMGGMGMDVYYGHEQKNSVFQGNL